MRRVITVPETMWLRLLAHIADNDYCYFCDNHPSHGHSKDCPVLSVETKPYVENILR